MGSLDSRGPEDRLREAAQAVADDTPEPGEPQHVVPLPDEGHILIDLVCWCHPYPDPVEPEVIIHRKAAEA